MASIKNFGLAGVSADLQMGKGGGRIVFDSANAVYNFTENDGSTLENIAAATVTFTDLADGAITIEQFDNDGSLTANSAVRLPTQQAVKVYIDDITNGGGMAVAADPGNGSGSIIFATETFTLTGTDDQITTFYDGTNTFRIEIDTNPVLEGNVTANASLTTPTANVGTLSFTGGGADVDSIIDDDTMATASATTLATSESVKAYIDNELSAGGLAMNIDADTGSGSIVFSSERLNLAGTANQIETSFADPANITFALADAVNITTSLNIGSTIAVTGTIDDDTMATASATTVATSESIKAYVDTEISEFSANLSVSDSSTSGIVDMNTGTLTIQGTANEVDVSFDDGTDTFTIGMPDDIIITGNLTVNGTTTVVNTTELVVEDNIITVNSDGDASDAGLQANVDGTLYTFIYSNANSFWTVGTQTLDADGFQIGTVAITDFVTESEGLASADNDTSVPTTAAVIDYISNNAGDGLMLRNTFTANSSDTTVDIGTMPNVTARTYYCDKIVLRITTPFAGGSFNHILVKENGGSGTTLVAADDADGAVGGTYVVELDGSFTLTKNASVQLQFLQSDGTTPAVVTSGAVTATAHYNWV